MAQARRAAPADPRIPRRRKSVSRNRRRRWFSRVAVVAVVAATAWTAFSSPLLEVRRVRVLGGKHTSAADVAAAARLDDGENLLLLSTSEVADRVAELPWVRRARVDRRLPGTVVVHVTERAPAMVLAATGARWTIDGTGRVLARGELVKGLPVLAGPRLDGIEAGERLAGSEVGEALKVFRALPSDLSSRTVAVFAPDPERISLSLKGGVIVRFGGSDHLKSKTSVLRTLLRELAQQQRLVAYVDVRVPTNPAVSSVAPSDFMTAP